MNYDVGLYGLGVMGQSLSLNIMNHGFNLAVYNYDVSVTNEFIHSKASGYDVKGCSSEKEFVSSLKKPRKIIMMVTAGRVVDEVIERILPLLEDGDILIDGGNSYYKDTKRRIEYCSQKGINFFGVGISGGEMGALKGPSIMPGGSKEAYEHIRPILESIAAKTKNGQTCCAYIGPEGSGHYVKMVHNGIEYGDIQLICEAYDLLKRVGNMSPKEMADIFEAWNNDVLNSYLIDITSKILRTKDHITGKPIIDVILDVAGQKGTGKWTSIDGLDKGCPIPTVAESVFARFLSSRKEERVKISKIFNESIDTQIERQELIESLKNALYCAKVISYAQGFALLEEASNEYGWNLNLGIIALLWREGCIIRAQFLEMIKEAFEEDLACRNLMCTNYFKGVIKDNIKYLRKIVTIAIENGIYVPCLTSALEYYDGYRSERLPANLLQAQRDYFGAHSYKRIDDPENKDWHTVWEN